MSATSEGLPAAWGGVERHVEELGARLVERGHEVTVFCRSNYSEVQAASIAISQDMKVASEFLSCLMSTTRCAN